MIMSDGDLKIGVVPRDEDILQLAYQEYVYDGASLGYTAGLEQLAQDFDMQQPSLNKWAAPIAGSRKGSRDDGNAEITKTKVSKYDPCVSFAAGAPVIKQDYKCSLFVNQNHTGSTSSSGKSTPGTRNSGGSTPPCKVTKRIDPCVTFIAGKPILTPPSEDDEDTRRELSRGAVNPITLKKALRHNFPEETNTEDNAAKKGRVIIKQHFDKEALQIAPHSTTDTDKMSSNFGENGKKSSAISVLRDDFRVPVSKNDSNAVKKNVVNHGNSRDATFLLSVSLAENDHTQSSTTVTYPKDLISRGQRPRVGGNLTSLTSQATLVESNSKSSFDRNQIARRGIRTHGGNIGKRDTQIEEKAKIGFVVATKERAQQQKISSSSDLSDDDSAVENKEVDGNLEAYLLKGNRRVSYLIATATSPTTTLPHKLSDISNQEADDEDSDTLNTSHQLHRQYSQESVETDVDDMKLLPVVKEGWLNKKLVHSSDGRRRASSRAWKALYTVLRGHYLYCYKDKIELEGTTYDEEQMQIINLKGSLVDIAHDYAKRKHVLRLTTVTGSEYLFQAQDTQSLMAWVNSIRENNPEKDTNVNAYESVIVKKMKSYEGGDSSTGISPPGTTKSSNSKRGLSLKKTHFTLGYKNTKKRGLVNIHISHGKDKEVQATGYTFGLSLEKCPPGKENEFVPVIIEHCCKVVESKGLDYLGIYRVPGNAAAVQLLQDELDNKEPEAINFEEEKWNDLNNIGSLLKSFLRKLPEPLIPKEMYSKFIDANREEDSNERLRSLRHLIRTLPDYHNQTLRYLINHLRLIADHSDSNRMEPKNLAIVFGPTVVRTSDENMVSMVKDMSDQCRIIETLIHQADWIYSVDDSMECAVEEGMQADPDGNKCYVASRGLLESLGQMAENFEGEQPNKNIGTKDVKDKGVASAIMSLTNFTSGISLKLRNKAISPVFSKKMGKQDNSLSPDSESVQTDDSTAPHLRRLASDPQILLQDSGSVKHHCASEGENEDDHIRVKSKIKAKYSRAVPLGPSTEGNKTVVKQPKSESRKNSCESEPQQLRQNNGANITLQIPLRAEVTVRDYDKRDTTSESYKAAMLSEKTRLRLQQVSVEHQVAMEKRQAERERIDKEREKTIRDLKQEEDESIGDDVLSSQVRDSDDSVSTTSESNASSRKESLDSLSSPVSARKYKITSRRIAESVSSDEKAPSYKLTQDEIDQREREQRQLDLFLGQFETSDEDAKQSPISESIPIADAGHARSITTVENLGAKSLDEKLRILLDPNFQEKDGKLVRRNLSSSSSNNSSTSPIDRFDASRNNPLGYGAQLHSKKADFAASIRRFDKPLKTKVIGLSAAKLNTPVYTPDMAARFDNFRQKKQELEKKVSSILQDSSKTKSIYDNESNKTDEQKVASLRQKTQMNKSQRLLSPTQRVIVSASDISQYPHRAVTAHRNIESSLQRLDRNVQQVVELLHDSNMKELQGENSELAALLNNLQRQVTADSDPGALKANKFPSSIPEADDRSAPYQSKGKRAEVLSLPINASKHEPNKGDRVRVQRWRTGSEQPKPEYGQFYPR
ncbi:uncharacterized protein LOC135682158 isoform X2 [Rhopilema esculentum]|uniref:uncharacterized protein LOC135682158 isoform X2 n=1 Tax=Rhopilema esculentum TaxID=499914 RepID=UPI0031D5079C